MELWKLGGTECARAIRNGTITARAVTESVLSRLIAVNPAINAVVQRCDDEALQTADRIDSIVARGEDPGPMAGVPVTIKENVDQKGHPTTNGLRIQKDLIADTDSPLVANLRRAGAVIVGRTNTPSFSLRWFTRNALHGHTRNPHNPDITPGGSSGGAAAATAAGIGAVGHGTDIAGSIRYPAYACGLQGIRPTLGRVPAWNGTGPDRNIGAQLMAVSGPLARSIADLRLSLEVMARPDPGDPWHVPMPLTGPEFPRRAALCVHPDGMATTPHVEIALRDAAARLTDAGWDVAEIECPPLREPARLQLQFWLFEMYRAGFDMFDKEDDADARHILAEFLKLSSVPDLDDLATSLQARVGFMRRWQTLLSDRPVVICPVSAEPPFPDLLDLKDFPRVLTAQMTQVGLPFLGFPGMSVFTGYDRIAGGTVPLGAQLVGPRFREDILFDAAEAIEARGPALRIATPGCGTPETED